MGIVSVLGKIEPSQLGKTYIHEHLCIDLSKQKKDDDAKYDNFTAIIDELTLLKSKGIKSVVEVTNIGMGRNIRKIKEISKKSGIQVIASTGFYKEPFLPEYIYKKNEKELAKILIDELTIGIDGSGIKAHVIGEIGSSYNEVKPMEEKIFRACALAHLETGNPISTHTSLGTMGLWQVEFFKKQGINMDHLVIGHMDLVNDKEYHLKIANYGCFLAFDTIGKVSYQTDENRIECLKNLIGHGHIDQIVISQDLTRRSHLKNQGGIGYSYLIDSFMPKMKHVGITDEQIEKILIDNPRRFLNI